MCVLVFVMLTVLPKATTAQQAPDFSVTDATGMTHELYNDYLDEGHAMVLGFFYEGAPMVNSLYPMLQQYAQLEWSIGTPVNFILMSGVDYNQSLLEFSQSLGVNLPVCGSDGGASEAIAPYIDGTYGEFYGYPMFVVLGPQGDVIYAPWGSNYESIISAIDDAVKSLLGLNVSVIETEARTPGVRAETGLIRLDLSAFPAESAQFFLHDLSGRRLADHRLTAGWVGTLETSVSSPSMAIYTLIVDGQSFSGKLILH